MSLPVIRSRLSTSAASFHDGRRLLCSATSIPKDPSLSSSSQASSSAAMYAGAASSSQQHPSATSPPTPPPSSGSSLLKFLQYTLIGAFTGAAATAGYATYAYTLDEVDEKAKAFRASANSVVDDESTVDKIKASVQSTVMKACAGAIDSYLDIRKMIEEHVRDFTEPSSDKLLPDLLPAEQHVYTLVLDLSETLIHSDWKRDRGWRTFKRPGVDAFLEQLGQYYEIVVYTDQLNTYADEIVGRLSQPQGYIRYCLSRAATKYQNGKHYRDLSKLNRDPSRIIYVSAHALESCLQRENCVQIKPWSPEDVNDTTLLDLIPFLQYIQASRPDVRQAIASYEGKDIIKEFIERYKEHQRRIQQQKQNTFWRR